MSGVTDVTAEQFTCRCGDEEFPLVKTDDEEDVWGECGLRIEPQRERATERKDAS